MEPTRKTTLASLCAEAGSLEGLLELLGLRQRGNTLEPFRSARGSQGAGGDSSSFGA